MGLVYTQRQQGPQRSGGHTQILFFLSKQDLEFVWRKLPPPPPSNFLVHWMELRSDGLLGSLI